MKKGCPISPDQVGELQRFIVPTFVFDAFNMLIAKTMRNGQANFTINDVWNEIKKADPTVMFDYAWLRVKEAYEDAGWKVQSTDEEGFVFMKK
jgi:hypothetical protein